MIRDATLADLAVMTQLTIAGRQDAYAHLVDTPYYVRFVRHLTVSRVDRKLETFMRQPGVVCLVYELDGDIVGYILGNYETKRITHLFINANARGRGLGHALMDRFLERVPNVGLTIEVVAANMRAITLYRKFGFYETKKIDKSYFGLEKIEMYRSI